MDEILVALTDIDIGAKLDAQNVKLEDWPKAKVPEGAIRKLEDVKDKFANNRFYKGEALHVNKVTDSLKSVSKDVPEGYRAMPVKVDEDTVMKAISPGDRVDVMVFLKRDVNAGISETGAYTFLKNVRVFAVNSNTQRSSSEGSGGKSENTNFRTISLLLKPEHTRELAVAAQMGKILITLRRPDEKDTAAGDEEVTPLSVLLGGNAKIASDPLSTPPFSQGGPLDPFRGVAPPPGAASAPAAQVAWSLQIMGPNGTEQYDWADKKGLPTKSGAATGGEAPFSPAPQAYPEDGPPTPTQSETESGQDGPKPGRVRW
jgi:pilus assembly protein CpaB